MILLCINLSSSFGSLDIHFWSYKFNKYVTMRILNAGKSADVNCFSSLTVSLSWSHHFGWCHFTSPFNCWHELWMHLQVHLSHKVYVHSLQNCLNLNNLVYFERVFDKLKWYRINRIRVDYKCMYWTDTVYKSVNE